MSESVPLCTHIKTDGVRCGSPAVSGTALCYHHSVVKTTLDKVPARIGTGAGEFEPIPFVFAEDRVSLQLNYFLLLTAFNEQRVDLRTCKAMMSLLKAMATNLGKTGSLVDEATDQYSTASEQEVSRQHAIGNNSQRSAVSTQKTVGNVALSAAAERRRGEEAGIAGLFSVSPDYGCLPSLMPGSMASADSFRLMARQAARGSGGRV